MKVVAGWLILISVSEAMKVVLYSLQPLRPCSKPEGEPGWRVK